jgi:hypothetical protein
MRILSLSVVTIALAVLAAVALWSPSLAAERPTAPEVPPSTTIVDNEVLARLLGTYVTPDLLVDYRALAANEEDREALRSWLAHQARVQVSLLPRHAQKAFWINLYNAATLELILRHYPLKSILKIGLIPGQAWKREFIRADGRLLSLDDIEHEILRKRFADPRIHFAVNCASASCPPLRREPYSAAELDDQLDRSSRDFLDSLSGLSHGTSGSELVLRVSKIFDWYREDFESHPGGVVGFIADYAPEEVSSLIRAHRGRVDVRYGKYDWRLNEPAHADEMPASAVDGSAPQGANR